jgi:GNAT superfamily N-acetyltransferase
VAAEIFTFRERPDLVERIRFPRTFGLFMDQDPTVSPRWYRLYEEPFDEFQLVVAEDDEPVARGHMIPLPWDGTVDDLPESLGETMDRGFAGDGWNAASALLAEVHPAHQGKGLSRSVIEAMAGVARRHGFHSLIAPVRPNRKERYPLTPIERYITWRRDDGFLFDPWLRVHERLGAEILRVAPRAMTMPGTVAQWEEWADMSFPESGDYVVPGALVPVSIDRGNDRGLYVEPNVWMQHRL